MLNPNKIGDEEEEDEPDEHLLREGEATLRRLVGATVGKRAAGKGTDIWIVFTGVTKDTTRSERSALFHDTVAGLKG
jgi:hypothetical protein